MYNPPTSTDCGYAASRGARPLHRRPSSLAAASAFVVPIPSTRTSLAFLCRQDSETTLKRLTLHCLFYEAQQQKNKTRGILPCANYHENLLNQRNKSRRCGTTTRRARNTCFSLSVQMTDSGFLKPHKQLKPTRTM